jgi:hypothetical protein
MKYSLLFLATIAITFLSCKKTTSSEPSTNPYDGSWKIVVLESGCGYSQPLKVSLTGGAFAVNSFGIVCTPLVNYTFGISGNVNPAGIVSGTLTSSNYGPPVPFTGACSSPDSCSATGSGIALTISK